MKIKTALEVSPVSLSPSFSLSFTPIAFLVFTTGAKIGSSWTFAPMNVNGMAAYNPLSHSYEALSPFSSLYYNIWFEGLFQFDLAAVMPGDWNHVVFVASYKPYYEGISKGGENENPWLWQGSGENVNAWQYYSNIILRVSNAAYCTNSWRSELNLSPSILRIVLRPVTLNGILYSLQSQ